MDQEELKEVKEKLIESLGVHIEKKDQLPPLAARIVSTLVLTGKKGATFEELVSGLQASKSTISTHLTNLQHSKNITYYTICGDRKKYFTINPNGMIVHMDAMLTTWENEKQLHIEVMNYKKEINKQHNADDNPLFDMEFHTDYLNYLEQASASIKNIREKLIAKTNKD